MFRKRLAYCYYHRHLYQYYNDCLLLDMLTIRRDSAYCKPVVSLKSVFKVALCSSGAARRHGVFKLALSSSGAARRQSVFKVALSSGAARGQCVFTVALSFL